MKNFDLGKQNRLVMDSAKWQQFLSAIVAAENVDMGRDNIVIAYDDLGSVDRILEALQKIPDN